MSDETKQERENDGSTRQSSPNKGNPLMWITIVGALVCIVVSIVMIKQHFAEKIGEDGLTTDERFNRDLDEFEKERSKALVAIEDAQVDENLLLRGIENPKFLSAEEAKLKDTDQVIGIAHQGVSRAYLLAGMSLKDTHIVHDRIGDTPLTVVYCDISKHARVFHRSIEARKIRLAGFNSKHLILQVQGKRFTPTSEKIPLADFKEHEVTTWGEWKKKHPESNVFAGQKVSSEKKSTS